MNRQSMTINNLGMTVYNTTMAVEEFMKLTTNCDATSVVQHMDFDNDKDYLKFTISDVDVMATYQTVANDGTLILMDTNAEDITACKVITIGDNSITESNVITILEVLMEANDGYHRELTFRIDMLRAACNILLASYMVFNCHYVYPMDGEPLKVIVDHNIGLANMQLEKIAAELLVSIVNDSF